MDEFGNNVNDDLNPHSNVPNENLGNDFEPDVVATPNTANQEAPAENSEEVPSEDPKQIKKKKRKKFFKRLFILIILFLIVNGVLYFLKKPNIFNLFIKKESEVWIITSDDEEPEEEQRSENEPSLIKITNPETLADIEETLNSLLLLNWYDDMVNKAGDDSIKITKQEGDAKSKLALAYKFIENDKDIKPNFKGTTFYYDRTVVDEVVKEVTGDKISKVLIHDGVLKYDSEKDVYYVNKDNKDGYFGVKVRNLNSVMYNRLSDYFVCEVEYFYPKDEEYREDEVEKLYDIFVANVVLKVDKQNKYLKYRFEDPELNVSKITNQVTGSKNKPAISSSRVFGEWTVAAGFTKDKDGNKENVSLQDVYGTSISYGFGKLIFNEDGTFTEDLAPVSEYDTPSSGTYEVSKGTELKLYYEEHFLHSEIIEYDKDKDTIDMNIFKMDGLNYGVTLKRVSE